MHLSEAVDTISYEQLIAKRYTYGFSENILSLILNYPLDFTYVIFNGVKFLGLKLNKFHHSRSLFGNILELLLTSFLTHSYNTIFFLKNVVNFD